MNLIGSLSDEVVDLHSSSLLVLRGIFMATKVKMKDNSELRKEINS